MMPEKGFQAVEPASEFLRKYISSYYFHFDQSEGEKYKFTYYPNTERAITIYKQSRIDFSEGSSIAVPDSSIEYYHCFTGFDKSIKTAEIVSPFDKIGILFRPIGLNYFLEKPLMDELLEDKSGPFDYFKEEMKSCLDSVYQITDVAAKVKLLDEFFLSRYVGFDEPRVERAVDCILNDIEKRSIESICNELQITDRTLLRLFKKHIGYSTKDFIMVHKFRSLLKGYKLNKHLSFTELSHLLKFYDQADMNNHIKKVTRSTPKRLLPQLKGYNNSRLYWKFEH